MRTFFKELSSIWCNTLQTPSHHWWKARKAMGDFNVVLRKLFMLYPSPSCISIIWGTGREVLHTYIHIHVYMGWFSGWRRNYLKKKPLKWSETMKIHEGWISPFTNIPKCKIFCCYFNIHTKGVLKGSKWRVIAFLNDWHSTKCSYNNGIALPFICCVLYAYCTIRYVAHYVGL